MVQRFDITGVHTVLGGDTRMYANNKLANLDRYIPRHGRNSARLELRLQEQKINGKKLAVGEAILHLPRRTISLKERGTTLYATIDLLQARLKLQIKKYKDEFANGKQRRHMFARFHRRGLSQISITNN